MLTKVAKLLSKSIDFIL